VAAAIATDAGVQCQAVQPDGEELGDDWQHVKSNAKCVVVVQQTGTFTVARLLLYQTRRVDGCTVKNRRRKTCSQEASMQFLLPLV